MEVNIIMKKKIISFIIAFCLAVVPAFAATYTVKPGDTMWLISSKTGYSVSDILSANPQIKNPSFIYSGQVINLPSGTFATKQQEVLKLVNAERSSRGIMALKMNSNLNYIATLKAQDMARKNYFSHISPTYGTPFTMMQHFGVKFTAAGENIAMGQRTSKEVMNAWMNSPGHRSNILSPSYNQMGIGVAKNSNGVYYWVQMFIKSAY